MRDIKKLTEEMFGAAAGVFERLVEMPVFGGGAVRADHEGSIKVDDQTLVTTAHIASLGIDLVARFERADVARVVGIMLGGGDEAAEMGAMQLSIVSETVCQIAAAMGEQLERSMGAQATGVRAALCSDATNLPPPPFVSFEGVMQIGSHVRARIFVDFDGIAAAKLAGDAQPVAAHANEAARRAPSAAPVAFAAMSPTTARSGHGGGNLDLVHDVPLQISAVLGKTALTLRDVVALQSGSVFELDKLSSDPIDLYVNNILIARGEVVVVDEKFAVKISELNPTVA